MEHTNAVGADDEHGQPQGDKQRRYGNRRTSRSADPWAGLRPRPMILRERELVHLFQIGSSNGVLDELGEATANVGRDARAAMSLGRRGARVRVDCKGTLDLTIAGYARARSHPRRFVVLPGHEEPTVESTVEVYPGYLVVEKRGEAGRIAEVEAGG